MNNKRLQVLFYNAVLFLLALFVTLKNLGIIKYFVGEDSGLSFTFPDKLFDSTYYMWDSLTAPGKMNISSTFGFIWANFMLILFKIGFSDILIKRVFYFVFFFASGSGMFYLLNTILYAYAPKINKNWVYFSAFVGSLLYMLNPFTMHVANLPIIAYHSSYFLLPLTFGLFIYNLQVSNSLLSTIIFSIFAFLLINANPSNTISIGVFFLFYIVFFRNEITMKISQVKQFFFTSLIIVLFLTSYIYLPIIFARTNPYGQLGPTTGFLDSLKIQSSYTSILNLLRLTGGVIWANFSFYKQYINNPFVIFISFLFPLLILISFFLPFQKKLKTFFGLIIVIFVFLAEGSHPPFGNFSIFLYKTIPFFGMFRAVYYKFAFFVVLSYSVLICLLTEYFFIFIKSKKKKIIASLFILLTILVYAWPFFAGLIPKEDYLTQIPESYLKLRNFLRKDATDFKVLSLPPAPKGAGLLLEWDKGNKYSGPHPDSYLIGKPVIDSYWFIQAGYKNSTVADSWIGTKFEDSLTELINLLGFFNIKYLLVHKDFVEKYDFGKGEIKKINGGLKTKKIISILSKLPQIKLILQTSNYMLYKIPDEFFLPSFYIPNKVFYTDKQLITLFTEMNKKDKTLKYAILPKNINNTTRNTNNKQTPVITSKQINPSRYQIKIEKVKGPFYLVFSETFDNNWRASINGNYISADNHYLANGYANAWSIENKEDNFQILIEYLPQKFFNIGLLISSFTLLFCFAYIIFSIYKKFK